MASNLSVNVTADATNLRRELTAANQQVTTFGATLRSLSQITREAGAATAEQTQLIQTLSQKYTQSAEKASELRAKLAELKAAEQNAAQSGDQVVQSHGRMGASAGVTREVLVMLHETMMGNYKRLMGSTVVLAERTNLLHTAMQSLTGPMGIAVGAAAALAGGLAFLAIRAHEAATALREIGNEAVFQGRSGPQAVASARALAESLKETGIVGHAAAYTIMSAIERIPRVTEDQRAKIASLAPGFFVKFGEDAEETQKHIGEIFASDSSLKSYLDKYQFLNREQQLAWGAATSAAQRYEIGLSALADRLGPVIKQYGEAERAASLYQASVMASAPMGGMSAPMPGAPEPAAHPTGLRNYEPGTEAPSAEEVERTELLMRTNKVREEAARLERELEVAQKARMEAFAAGERGNTDLWIATEKRLKDELARLKEAGDADWASKIALQAQDAGNRAVIAAREENRTKLQITEAEHRAELAVYQQAAQDTSRTEAERTAMKRRAIDIEISLAKEGASEDAKAAKEAFAAKVAAFDAEIAAARGNAAAVMDLERQKLTFIRQAKGEASAEYQRALKEENGAVAAAAAEQIRDMISASKQKIEARRAELADEANLRQITRAQEFSELARFQQAEEAAQLTALDGLIATLDRGSSAYEEAMKRRAQLIEQFRIDDMRVQSEMDQAAQQSAERQSQEYSRAFMQIGSSAERAFAGYATGSTTWVRAEQQITRSLLDNFLSLTTTMAERWLIMELAKTGASTTQNAVRTAQEQSAGASGFPQLIAAWTAKETAQTGITEAHAAVRSTADSGGGFLSGLASILSRWVGMEAGKDAATAAGAGTRAAEEEAAALASSAVIGAAARLEIATSAAAAGAAAFADSAMLGPEGLAAAPEAAAGAYGATMAFQAAVPAFDIGSNYIPNDMLAMVHRGEIVVPAAQADAVRSGGGFNLPVGGVSTGANTHIHFNISAIDGPSVASFFNAHAAKIAQTVSRHVGRNPSSRPSYA